MEAIGNFGRSLKIKYFFRHDRNNFNKPRKSVTSRSNWVPPNKGNDPDLLEWTYNFTKEIKELSVPRETQNSTIKENKKADKGSVVVIMEKRNCITEVYNQLNNDNHYEKLSQPIYHRTAI